MVLLNCSKKDMHFKATGCICDHVNICIFVSAVVVLLCNAVQVTWHAVNLGYGSAKAACLNIVECVSFA